MTSSDLGLSIEQKEFLAVMITIDQPVSQDIVEEISELSVKSFLKLLNRGTQQPLIRLTESGMVELVPGGIPPELRKELAQYKNRSKMTGLLKQLEHQDLLNQMKPETLINLFKQAGQEQRLAFYEIKLANRAQESAKFPAAIEYLENAITRLFELLDEPENQPILISSVFNLSFLLMVQGTFSRKLIPFLTSVTDIAKSSGDQRSLALAFLHLGLWQFFSDQKAKGFERLCQGKKMVEDIGDEDIMCQSLTFRVIYYTIQGRYREALGVFDQSYQRSEVLQNFYSNHFIIMGVGLSAAFLGQFNRAVGFLDSNWHLAKSRKLDGLAASIRALLGRVLTFMGKRDEALVILKEIRREAEENNFDIALIAASAGLGNYYLEEGDHDKACKIIVSNRMRLQKTGFIGLFNTSWAYEAFYELQNNIRDVKIKNDFRHLIYLAVEDINIHIHGVALRLKAIIEKREGVDSEAILNLLMQSERCLKESGDPVQLAKTQIELVRMKLNQGDQKESRRLALEARMGLSGFFEDQYPNDLRFLLEEKFPGSRQVGSEKVEEMVLSLIESLVPIADCDQLVKLLLVTINKFIQAERMGLFWFGDLKGRIPTLRVGYNLIKTMVFNEDFQSSMALILDSFKKGHPKILRYNNKQPKSHNRSASVVVCLPFEVEGRSCAVLYMDYSYGEFVPALINKYFLKSLQQHIGAYFERIYRYENLINETKHATISSSIEIGHTRNNILPTSQNQKMVDIYKDVKKLAKTDATVLLMGETGTGKEVMSRLIHQQSHRADKPFIIIDPTTITESLFESELFGHEKGAFTGADRLKSGRVELAQGGTLFIDEIGEIPLNIQVKLLRVLQEKSFVRVGGTRLQSSDFRLIVATNCNLSKEVKAGRFREDLYYRIKMIEFTLPSLRERNEDIIPLAEFFLKQSAKKYHRPEIKLSPENKSWLKSHKWPGNIRELSHTIEKAVLTSTADHLEFQQTVNTGSHDELIIEDLPTMDDMQRRYIRHVLKKTGGKMSGKGGASEILGMKRTTLIARMRKLTIDKLNDS